MAAAAAPDAVAVAHELLTQAKESGGHDVMWEVIFEGLRAAPKALVRPESRSYALLHQAAYWGKASAVNVLLTEFGADPLEKSKDGQTPAEVAEERGHKAVAEQLRAAAAPASPALAQAAVEQVANGLLDKAKSAGGEDATWEAVFADLRAVPGAVKRPEKRTFSLLHQAVYWGHRSAVETLIKEFGADPLELTAGNPPQTPAEVALERGHQEVAELLGVLPAEKNQAPLQEIQRLDRASELFDRFSKQFHDEWKPGNWHPSCQGVQPPRIKDIWLLDFYHRRPDHVVRKHEVMKQVGGDANEVLRFHGTRLCCDFAGTPCNDQKCCVCGILREGKFLLSKRGQDNGAGVYGNGLYFTTGSHTAKGYGVPANRRPPESKLFAREDAGNAVFGALVVTGHAEEVEGTPWKKSDTAPKVPAKPAAFYHSRIIKKPTQNDELVVFDEGQVIPRCLFIFG